MYASVYILVLSILVIGIRGQTFTSLPAGKECPATSEGWKKLADAKSCPGNAPYHCVINEYGEFGEVCVKESWVQPGFCPEYNTAAKKINVKRCQPFDGFSCSTQAFQSHQTYSHEICLRKPKPTTTTVTPPVSTTVAASQDSSPVAAIVIILLLIVIIVGGILVWWFYLRKNYNCQIPIPFTGGTITICHKPEEVTVKTDPAKTPLLELGETPTEKKVNRSNPNFVETKIYREIIRQLEKNNIVLVVGNTGIGKSATSVGVLEHYRDIKEWKTIHFPFDQIEKVDERTIVLVDVTFGDFPLYSHYDANIENMMNRLYTSTRECKEFKLLITSSRSLKSCQKNFSILKGCFELNMSYDTSDLKNLYKEYTEPKCSIVKETEEMSKERSKSNQVLNKDKSSDKAKDASNHDDDETSSALEKDNDEMENKINEGPKLSDSVASTKSNNGPPLLSINPQQSEESAMRNERNNLGDHNQTSTEETCNGIEEDMKSSRDPEISCPPVKESGEDRETDPSKVELEVTDDHEEGNLEEDGKLKQEAEGSWKKSNVSKFGLPIVCYLPGGIEWNVPSSEDLDVMSSIEIYINNLADQKNGLDRQKYKTLVYIMLNGSIVDSEFLHKKLLSEIDQNLTPDRFLARAYELAEVGVLEKKGNLYSFHNDLLLFAVIHSFASRDIRTFTSYCYLPFLLQFLRPKSTHSPKDFEVEVDVNWGTLCEFGSELVKRQKRNGNEFKEFELYQIFRDRLQFHEEGMMKFYKIDKTTMDDKKGNAFVRKMVNHYPELKEYYSYAEPDKFRSVPESAFKATVKQQPPCSQNKNDFTKK